MDSSERRPVVQVEINSIAHNAVAIFQNKTVLIVIKNALKGDVLLVG